MVRLGLGGSSKLTDELIVGCKNTARGTLIYASFCLHVTPFFILIMLVSLSVC